jgi:hypothetical protein
MVVYTLFWFLSLKRISLMMLENEVFIMNMHATMVGYKYQEKISLSSNQPFLYTEIDNCIVSGEYNSYSSYIDI